MSGDAHNSQQTNHDAGHGHDDWFRHDESEGLPQVEHAAHIDTTSLGVAFLVTVFGVLGVIVVLVLYFSSYTTQLKAERQEGIKSGTPYMTYRDEAETKFDAPASALDKENGVYRIPIDRAMDLIVDQYADDSAAVPPASDDSLLAKRTN